MASDAVERSVLLNNRFMLFQLVMHGPYIFEEKQPELIGGAVNVSRVCIVCGERQDVTGQARVSWSDNVNYPHKEGCAYGQLVNDFMIETVRRDET